MGNAASHPTSGAGTSTSGWISVLGDGAEIVAELGRGTHATVYRVRRAGVEYAVKVLDRPGPGTESALVRFRREAALLARVNHPGVPRVFDVGVAGGHPYLVQELIDGRALSDRLLGGWLDPAALVPLGLDVASALAAAHAAGLVHRDVKPANIIMTGSGRARIVDFGLAAAGRTGDGDTAVGTFDYAAPEQSGMLARPVDGRADLYSLGVVLFECATGQRPYQHDDVGHLLALHATAPIPDPRELRPELAADFGALVMRLLAKDPDDRVQTAEELCAELRRLDGAGPRDDSATKRRSGVVGRERERAELAGCWQRARAGRGGVALIEGPAGVGKTALAQELLLDARADGALVLSGACDADALLPVASLRAAVAGYLRELSALPASQRALRLGDLRAAAGADAGLLRPLSETLAGLLGAPRLAVEDRRDQFASAVASFLGALAARHGSLLLLVEDVQWLDPVSRDALHKLAGQLADVPLLLVATARDDEAAAPVLRSFVADIDGGLTLRLPLPPLDVEQAGRLIESFLTGSTVHADVTADLTARGGGNPFTILEYLHALVEAGALRPSWGSWYLDSERLQALDLPTDVLDLVLARIDGLSQEARDILTTAAALGSRFQPGLLAAVVEADPCAALSEAVDRGLIHVKGADYSFVHERALEALLASAEPEALRGLHRRIATVLAGQNTGSPAQTYALARHCANGGLDHDPERSFWTGWAAARLAMSENAPESAASFLDMAAAAAEAAGIELDSMFREERARVYLALGDPQAARGQLEPALAEETVPLRRAALLLQLAHVHRAGWHLTASVECVRAGLAELGWPLPRNRLQLGLTSLRTLLWWLLTGGRPPSARPATGQDGERLRLHAQLCRAGSAATTMGMSPLSRAFGARGIRHVHRLGPCTEYVMAYAVTGVLATELRLHRRKTAVFRRLSAMTAELGDPQLNAFLTWIEAYTDLLGGRATIAQWVEVCEPYKRWLEPDHYAVLTFRRCADLIARGYAEEALDWLDHSHTRIRDPHVPQSHGLALIQATGRAMQGRQAPTPEELTRLGEPGLEPVYALQLAATAVFLAVEHDELGTPFDDAVEAFARVRASLPTSVTEVRTVLAWEALGRLARCQRAGPASRADLLSATAAAVEELHRVADGPLLRGYHVVARASLTQIRGEPATALALLARAEKLLVRLDAPLVHYEAARVRARALGALGQHDLARDHANHALTLATTHGWTRRLRWVRTEFGAAPAATRGSGRQTSQSDWAGHHYKRRLQALQQIGAAAATVLDPQRLARVALDEVLRILGAERAILFLYGDDGRLSPSLGRTGVGALSDLTEITGYAASLVRRVATDRRPLVVTGSEEGAALGSRSTVAHGLRSVMIAPLERDERLLGVVYVDSRVARGVFTEEDVEILTAVASQVAASMETARASQLEVAVEAARRQRDTAETLRNAVSHVAAALDPPEVLHRLRDIVARALPADLVFMVHRDSERTTVAGPARGRPVNVSDMQDLDTWVTAGPRIGDAATCPPGLASVVDGAVSWLLVPLTTRGHGNGVLVATSARTDAFNQAHLDIAAAIVGQGVTAYANARLFAQVQQLASTDYLTGALNRRQFAQLAARRLDIAVRNRRPLAALMIDIDHFKMINDSLGHAVGDEVIRAVAQVLQANMRESDVLGRYGGEEFAVVATGIRADPVNTAERLRVSVEDLAVPGPDGPVRVTVSIGLATLKPDDGLDALLARADEALYRAKRAGRNRCESG